MQNAIPTRYAGVNFRSRLEARWAAFFDLVGWAWEYEPLDLNGYIPDFIVEHGVANLPYGGSVLPMGWVACPARPGIHTARRLIEVKPDLDLVLLMSHAEKIDRSGWTGLAAIVGAALHDEAESSALGVARYDRELSSRWWQNWGASLIMIPRTAARSAWREAANRVQWMGVDNGPEVKAESEAADA